MAVRSFHSVAAALSEPYGPGRIVESGGYDVRYRCDDGREITELQYYADTGPHPNYLAAATILDFIL